MTLEKDLLLLYLKNIKQSNYKIAKLLAFELVADTKKKKVKNEKKKEIEDEGEKMTAHQFVYHY